MYLCLLVFIIDLFSCDFSLSNHYTSSLLTWFFLCPNYCHNINTHTHTYIHTYVFEHIHMPLMALSENRFLSFKFKVL